MLSLRIIENLFPAVVSGDAVKTVIICDGRQNVISNGLELLCEVIEFGTVFPSGYIGELKINGGGDRGYDKQKDNDCNQNLTPELDNAPSLSAF